MSWFHYGKPEPKKRKLRKGVWLRVQCLPEDIYIAAREKLRSITEVIRWVIVSEIRPDGKVLLEFWCQEMFDPVPERYTVFYLFVGENPEWVCEGDLGRGWKDIGEGEHFKA